MCSWCSCLVSSGRWIRIQRMCLDNLDSEHHWGTCALHGEHIKAPSRTTWRNWSSWTTRERRHKEIQWGRCERSRTVMSAISCTFTHTGLISRFSPCSLLDEPCSAPFQMSHCAAGAETPALPTLRTRRLPLTYCSPAPCRHADTPCPLITRRARRVSPDCNSWCHFVFRQVDKTYESFVEYPLLCWEYQLPSFILWRHTELSGSLRAILLWL